MIHSIALGDGPPVILIHGMASSLHDWDTLLPIITAAGYRAWALDLPGHGDSQKPDDPNYYTKGGFIAAVDDWLAALPDQPPYILIGHSLGGYLSLRFALRNPEKVRLLVLIDPLFSLKHISFFMRWSERMPGLNSLNAFAIRRVPRTAIQLVLGFPALNNDRLNPKMLCQTAVDYKRASPHMLRLTASIEDLEADLPRICAPSLVIWGDHDLTLDPASFPRLVAALPNSHGSPIRGSGHQPHLGRPELVNPLVMDFIRSHSAPAADFSVAPINKTAPLEGIDDR
jgi:3-oxoadipate enol-lactonase